MTLILTCTRKITPKGKLIKVSSAVSATEYTGFDGLGRILSHKQSTNGGQSGGYTTGYTYNLGGALIKETYPSGRVVKNTLDQDGDLQQIQSRKSNDTFRNYANGFVYNAAGAVTSLRLGNGKWESTQFNSRLQPTQIGLGGSATNTSLLKLNYDYGGGDNNGNVKSQTITVPTVGANQGFTATQTYTYDSLNRIKDAVETVGTSETWRQTFLYDRYGNRTFDTTANRTTTISAGCSAAVCNPSVDPATNKLIGYQFDNSGNTKVDANGQVFTYDSENKQVQVNNSAGVVGQYVYNGDGQRIKKIVPSTGETTIFVYDASNKVVAEYSTVVEPQATAKISYLTNDHLGSPRITTDGVGQVVSRRDFRPFGEEISRTTYGSDSIRQKFTGYERDNESDLDFAEARYYNKNHGRFTSVDPLAASASPSDPQSFNRYIYVRNSPLVMTDPSGMIGDYYSYSGQYINSDGKKDGLVYFATFAKSEGGHDYVYTDSISETTIEEVNRAKSFFTPSTPGTDNEAVRTLTGTVANSAIAGAKRIPEGVVNAVTSTVNTLTNPLGPVGAVAGVPNPIAIPQIQGDTPLEQDYIGAGKAGTLAGTIFVGGAVGSESSVSVVPNTVNKASGLEVQLELHQEKLVEYAKNPYLKDNKGFLRNNPQNLHADIIQGRVRNLVQQIRNFEKQIRK